jgi:hypothetical protein
MAQAVPPKLGAVAVWLFDTVVAPPPSFRVSASLASQSFVGFGASP